jgi:hypothetical protein
MPTFSTVLHWLEVQANLRTVFAILLQVIAGFIALTTLLLSIDLLKAAFSQGTDSSTTLALLFFVIGFAVVAFCLGETSLYRARSIKGLKDSAYPMLAICSQVSRWAGELYATLMIGAGVIVVFGTLLSKNAGFGLNAIGSYFLILGAVGAGIGEASLQSALRLLVVMGTPGLLFLVFAYAIAEVCQWLADMAQYNRLQALQSSMPRQ